MATSGYKQRGFATRKLSNRYNRPKYNPTGTAYKSFTNLLRTKVNSYQTLIKQSQGTGRRTPTPAALNMLAKWVDKGAIIQTVSNAQLRRWARTNRTFSTPTTAKNVLWNKFGKMPIKAVYNGKGGDFIVATLPTWRGKAFRFPH